MKISVNIETNDPADLIRVGNALAGVMADPTPSAAEKPKVARATTKAEPPAATTSAGPQSDASAGAPTTTSASSATADVAVTEAELTAAANAASAKIGATGPGKVKDWIAQNFQKSDGSAGTLRLTREDQRPALLRGLQEIGQGVKAI